MHYVAGGASPAFCCHVQPQRLWRDHRSGHYGAKQAGPTCCCHVRLGTWAYSGARHGWPCSLLPHAAPGTCTSGTLRTPPSRTHILPHVPPPPYPHTFPHTHIYTHPPYPHTFLPSHIQYTRVSLYFKLVCNCLYIHYANAHISGQKEN